MKKAFALLLLFGLLWAGLCAVAETVCIEGVEYDAALETLDLTRVSISDEKALEEALCAMPSLTYVDLTRCGLDNETLALLRARMAERGVKVVWTLRFAKYEVRTDATVFSTLRSSTDEGRLSTQQISVLQYATELRALDLGHNWIKDISWMEPLTELRVVVLSDNRIQDFSPLAGKPLEYLEAFNNAVNDISFLAGCDTLMDLNLCLTHVTDLSPLYDLPNLKRVYISSRIENELTQEAVDAFLAHQRENLEAYNFSSQYPTLYGWREDDRGVGHPRYEIIKAMFKESVYYDFNTVLRPEQYVQLYRKK